MRAYVHWDEQKTCPHLKKFTMKFPQGYYTCQECGATFDRNAQKIPFRTLSALLEPYGTKIIDGHPYYSVQVRDNTTPEDDD